MKFQISNILKPKLSHAKWMALIVVLAIFALGAFDLTDAIKRVLDAERYTFHLGEYSVSAYAILHGLVVLVLVFWLTAILSETIVRYVNSQSRLGSSNRALLSKFLQIIIYSIAVLVSLDIIGLDLTTLTVFGGALGLGLGFGLQKIASNFVSGLILLMEKAVEQDDLIELPDSTLGYVRKSSARYTLVETIDGKEILIPNEDLITLRVINWTLTSKMGRVEISVGVSYGSDLRLAHKLILEAAKEHSLCISEPPPVCYLKGFGDSSIDFVLWFWIEDITTGRWGPRSDVHFAIWEKFAENGITIPFPQRDLHIQQPSVSGVVQDCLTSAPMGQTA